MILGTISVTVHSPYYFIMKSDEIYFFILWIKKASKVVGVTATMLAFFDE